VSERLRENSDLDASDIEVEVNNGEVTLKGEVADRNEKWLAEECADVSGVNDITNQLRIRRSSEKSGTKERGSSYAGSSSSSQSGSQSGSQQSSLSGTQRSRTATSS
jgi:hypothetical protein